MEDLIKVDGGTWKQFVERLVVERMLSSLLDLLENKYIVLCHGPEKSSGSHFIGLKYDFTVERSSANRCCNNLLCRGLVCLQTSNQKRNY